MGLESESGLHTNNLTVSDVVKKLLTTFFSANIPYTRGLDIYGSIHVRADNCDVVCCILNEHCLKPDKTANSDDGQSAFFLPGSTSFQSGRSNTASRNECLPERQGASTKEPPAKKPVSCQEENRSHSKKDDGAQAKCKKLSGVSRKLSKLNRSKIAGLNYLANSVFPETLALRPSGNRSVENEKLEERQRRMTGDTLESEIGDKSEHRSEDQSSSDDPNIDLAMAATSEVDTPEKSGVHFDDEGEMADVDSGDGHVFDSIEKGGSYSFGSPQSFNHQSVPFSNYNAPSVGVGETEILSQSAWLSSDVNTRLGSQVSCSSSSFDGSSKAPGPLTSEKICVYCLKVFHTNLEMSHHIQHEHSPSFPPADNDEERPYRPRYQNTYAYGGSDQDVDRQLTCSVCSLSFRSLDGLRCHENSKHLRNKLYKCQFCTQSFLTRQAAYTHRMKFHRLVPRNSQLLADAMTNI